FSDSQAMLVFWAVAYRIRLARHPHSKAMPVLGAYIFWELANGSLSALPVRSKEHSINRLSRKRACVAEPMRVDVRIRRGQRKPQVSCETMQRSGVGRRTPDHSSASRATS